MQGRRVNSLQHDGVVVALVTNGEFDIERHIHSERRLKMVSLSRPLDGQSSLEALLVGRHQQAPVTPAELFATYGESGDNASVILQQHSGLRVSMMGAK